MKLILLATLVASLALPTRAHAHGSLKAAKPAAGAHITEAPTSIHLVFSETPSLSLTSIRLLGPDGAEVSLGPLTRAADSESAVTTAIVGMLTSGVYTVRWQMAGDDGHPTRGTYRFTLALAPAMSGATMPAEQSHQNPISQPDEPGFGVESPAYVAIRWLQYCALLVIIGAIAFALVVLAFAQRLLTPPVVAGARQRAAGIAFSAAVLLALTALLRLFAQSYALHGESLAPDLALLSTLLRVTQWGHAWIIEAVATVIALVAFANARRGREGAWKLAALAGGAIALSMALSGHAAASPTLRLLAIGADTLHIVGAGGWLGSLLLVIVAGIPVVLRSEDAPPWPAVASLVNGFSPTALVFASMTAVTGVFAAWLHLETIPALWQTRYGQVLLLKLGVLSVTAAIGLYNWQRVKPVLDAGPLGTHRLQRSSAAELGIGVIVLLLTAILVATPTGMDM